MPPTNPPTPRAGCASTDNPYLHEAASVIWIDEAVYVCRKCGAHYRANDGSSCGTPVPPASAPAATPLMDSLRDCDEKAKDLPRWATDINAAHAAQYDRPAATPEPEDDGSESGEEFDAAYWPNEPAPEPDEALCECGFPQREHRIGYSRSRCTFRPAAPTGEEAEMLTPGAVLAHLHALWTYAERGDKEKWSERAATLSKAVTAQATALAALRARVALLPYERERIAEIRDHYPEPPEWGDLPANAPAVAIRYLLEVIGRLTGATDRAALAPRQPEERQP